MSLRRAVFLDRDGVLNVSDVRGGRPYAPTRLEDFEIYPEAPAAVASLRSAGFAAIVVTNQKDIGTGKTPWGLYQKMTARLRAAIELDDVLVCARADECENYKPNPGMLLEGAARHQINLAQSYMVGDRWRDIGAGRAAGCRTILVDRGYTEAQPYEPDLIAKDIADAADKILRGQ